MKLRFFLTIFAVLLFSMAAVSYTQFYFFQTERLRLIDRQIEQGATILLSSDLSRNVLEDIDEAENIIAEALGEQENDLLIRIHNSRGKVLYRNKNAEIIQNLSTVEHGWRTEEYEGHSVRLLSLELQMPRKRYLEVGLLMDRTVIHWRQVTWKVLGYLSAIFIFMLFVSALLARLVLRPLRLLESYLTYLTSKVDEGLPADMPLPRGLAVKSGPARPFLRDEFSELTRAVQTLVRKIAENSRSIQTWTAQMLHEIRTPLTIAANSLESAKAEVPQTAKLDDALGEIKQVSHIVGDFLEWAKTENAPKEALELHALRLGPFVKRLVEKFAGMSDGRLRLTASPDTSSETNQFLVFARPDLLEQVLGNLLENALKYSPVEAPVEVILHADGLSIRDSGPGLPEEVRKRLGQPFNAAALRDYPERRGIGLGLARVVSICRKYGWDLQFHSPAGGGNEARIIFPAH